MSIEIRLLGAGDEALLRDVAPGVFDDPVQPQLAAEFLADPRHHLAVAREAGRVVGMASAVHYVHPDKAAELWVNEVGVAPTHQRRGLATQLLRALFDAGRSAGCRAAWVLTDRSNVPAMRLYSTLGGIEADEQTVMFEFPLEGPSPVARLDPPEETRASPVRLMRSVELPDVLEMMRSLWPDCGDYSFDDETVFVWERQGGGLGGFVSFTLRPWAEGCDATPVPYIEGWWVAPDLRQAGVGRALVEAVERWCRAHGYPELGSDVELENAVSLAAHAALGFEPTLRLQFLRKRLT
ncbi:MAG TPA: GNAT family N-acetyltransferase [Vicinamibacterales bacterium]|nr:GNAT family N-acetyltransferase [Vicinamibacterales bacterium]